MHKNHEMTIVPYPYLTALQTYTLTINISDASANTNSSSVNFFIEEEDAHSPLPDENFPPGGPNGENPQPSGPKDGTSDTGSIADLFANSVVQLGLLLVVILVITALIRTRKYQD